MPWGEELILQAARSTCSACAGAQHPSCSRTGELGWHSALQPLLPALSPLEMLTMPSSTTKVGMAPLPCSIDTTLSWEQFLRAQRAVRTQPPSFILEKPPAAAQSQRGLATLRFPGFSPSLLGFPCAAQGGAPEGEPGCCPRSFSPPRNNQGMPVGTLSSATAQEGRVKLHPDPEKLFFL